MPEVTGYKCTGCDAVVSDASVDEEEVLYECGSCGEFKRSETDNEDHRCPHCQKFGSRSGGGLLCPECEEAALDTAHPLKLWQCGSCGTAYTSRKRQCPECKRKKTLDREKEHARVTPAEGPFTFTAIRGEQGSREFIRVPEAEIPVFDGPEELLRLDRLPALAKVGGLVYGVSGGYLKSARDVFYEGEPLECSYSLEDRVQDGNGDGVDLTERPGPYRDARECRRNHSGPDRTEFRLWWAFEPGPEGMVLRPVGAMWGDSMGLHRGIPVDVIRP